MSPDLHSQLQPTLNTAEILLTLLTQASTLKLTSCIHSAYDNIPIFQKEKVTGHTKKKGANSEERITHTWE